jgi:hypothetical protein
LQREFSNAFNPNIILRRRKMLTVGDVASLLPDNSDSIAFFTTINSCIQLSTQCHPISPRNADLVAVWQKWTNSLQRRTGTSLHSTHSQSQEVSFLGYEAQLWQQIRADRLFQSSQVSLGKGVDTLWEVTAPLVFWTHAHAIIEPTDALDQLLAHSDIGQELPVGLLRAPQSAVYICLGTQTRQELDAKLPAKEGLQSLTHQGVYVFEAEQDNHRVVTLVPIYEDQASKVYGASMLELHITSPDEALNNLIHRICHETGHSDYMMALAQAVTKLFLYMALPQAQLVHHQPYTEALDQLQRLGAKKTAKLRRQLPRLYDRMVVGPTEINIGRAAGGHDCGGGTDELSPHLRRGHFRLQPHGPNNSKRRLVFIAPAWVRADKLVV